MTEREKSILCGLLLSKYGKTGLDAFGFTGFSEAFNALGASLQAKPASIKNYRDELDPYFPNQRKGWHKRPLREHCQRVLQEYGERSLNELTAIIGGFLDPEFGLSHLPEESGEDDGDSTFARRLITGKAAEAFFESNFQTEEELANGSIVNTTQFGCGFDFRIDFDDRLFLAVEVKGLRESRGRIHLTWKEHMRAEELGDRYFLYVVSNFREEPQAQLWKNPLRSSLDWVRNERTVTIPTWGSLV